MKNTKLKYIGKEPIKLRFRGSLGIIKNGDIINVSERELERFKDREEFQKVNK